VADFLRFRLTCPRAAKRDYFCSLVDLFLMQGLTMRGDKHTRSGTPESHRIRTTPSIKIGVSDPLGSLASIPSLRTCDSVLMDVRRQRTKIVAPLATTDSSADSSSSPRRGNCSTLHRSTTPALPESPDRECRSGQHHLSPSDTLVDPLDLTIQWVTPFTDALKRGTSYPCTSY